MKLVELLAKELSKWPVGEGYAVQDSDGEVKFGFGNDPEKSDGGKVWLRAQAASAVRMDLALAEDCATAIVTREMWQAERDRQKGGEWKRHRGGKCPVPAGTKVSTRHRNGEVVDVHFHTATTGSGPATMNTIWKHTGDDHDIMQYKVISQPQAEEVETFSESVHKPIIEALNTMASEWHEDQIDGPIKWRDTVNELDAYIEEFTRQREALINRLADEGFALIGKINKNLDKIDATLNMTDWRNWKAGDIVVCKTDNSGQFTKGFRYEVESVNNDRAYRRVSISCDDNQEKNGWGAEHFKFHHRP